MNHTLQAQSLWAMILCLCALLAGLTVSALDRRRARWRGFMGGMLCSSQLFFLLPQAAALCSYLILLPSFSLGIIMSIFWNSAEPQKTEENPNGLIRPFALTGCFFLFCCGLMRLEGLMRLPLFWIYLPLGLGLHSFVQAKWLLPMVGSMGLGALVAAFYPLSARTGGMLLAISCGMLLQMSRLDRRTWGGGWTGGLLSGMLLSIL